MTPESLIVRPPEAVNIFGNLGPRCEWCSGLGRVLALGISGSVTRYASRCTCKGTGIDLEAVQRQQISDLVDRLSRTEQCNVDLLRKQRAMEAKLNSYLRNGKMSRQFWMECIAWATASGTAIATSTTETILFPNVTVPANYMQDGRCLRLTLLGSYGTTSTPTLILAVRWGGVSGTVIAKSSTITTTSAVGGGASMTALWKMELIIQTRANGSSGSLMTNGDAVLYTSTAGTAGTVTNYGMPLPIVSGSTGGTTPVAVTADLTADTALSVTALWGTSNAANSIQGLNYNIESLN